jgi:hypothetical protein
MYRGKQIVSKAEIKKEAKHEKIKEAHKHEHIHAEGVKEPVHSEKHLASEEKKPTLLGRMVTGRMSKGGRANTRSGFGGGA